jgi:hypothetical protein
MTRPGRISQAEMERAVKAALKFAPNSRIIIDLRNERIEIIIGEAPAIDAAEVWSDDD